MTYCFSTTFNELLTFSFEYVEQIFFHKVIMHASTIKNKHTSSRNHQKVPHDFFRYCEKKCSEKFLHLSFHAWIFSIPETFRNTKESPLQTFWAVWLIRFVKFTQTLAPKFYRCVSVVY